MVQLPRNYAVALRVRAGYRERDTRESKMGTYSVPGHVDGGDYHYIYDGWIERSDGGSCGIDGLASSCRYSVRRLTRLIFWEMPPWPERRN